MVNQSDKTPFVKLSFAGSRFTNARLPADASVNISIYQRVLVELAKQIWREKNPNRLRLPRNFERYFQLQLGDIKEGSAVAHLPRFDEDLPPLFGALAPGDIFDRAQDQLVEIVDAANDNKPLPFLSQSVRNELQALRKNLRESEDIIVTRGRMSRAADRHRISSATKERITKEIREDKSKSIVGFGIISGVSESPPEITVTSEHGVLKFEVNFETARATFNGQIGRLVDFNVRAIVDYDGDVKSLEAVNAFSLVDDSQEMQRAVNRVDGLSGLEAGWYDDGSVEISRVTILTARDIARFIASFDQTAGIFPTVDSEVSIEYTRNDLEWTVSIKNQHVVVEVLDLDQDESVVRQFKGTSRGLMQMLLSKNGIVDE